METPAGVPITFRDALMDMMWGLSPPLGCEGCDPRIVARAVTTDLPMKCVELLQVVVRAYDAVDLFDTFGGVARNGGLIDRSKRWHPKQLLLDVLRDYDARHPGDLSPQDLRVEFMSCVYSTLTSMFMKRAKIIAHDPRMYDQWGYWILLYCQHPSAYEESGRAGLPFIKMLRCDKTTTDAEIVARLRISTEAAEARARVFADELLREEEDEQEERNRNNNRGKKKKNKKKKTKKEERPEPDEESVVDAVVQDVEENEDSTLCLLCLDSGGVIHFSPNCECRPRLHPHCLAQWCAVVGESCIVCRQ